MKQFQITKNVHKMTVLVTQGTEIISMLSAAKVNIISCVISNLLLCAHVMIILVLTRIFFPLMPVYFLCIFSVIDNDLRPFESGINYEMFRKAKDKGTHYQIINHRLYREKECMFEFRCVFNYSNGT